MQKNRLKIMVLKTQGYRKLGGCKRRKDHFRWVQKVTGQIQGNQNPTRLTAVEGKDGSGSKQASPAAQRVFRGSLTACLTISDHC